MAVMILAGVDEAGLGPTLGPLVTAAAALAVPEGWEPDSPWEGLAAAFCREWRKGERRAAVADSKVLYKSGGLREFERTLGAFAGLMGKGGKRFWGLPTREEGVHPCYECGMEGFPVHGKIDEITAFVEEMRAACEGVEISPEYLWAEPLFEPVLNGRFAGGLNKNQALLMETGRHLRELVRRFAGQRMVVVVDKQGGRNEYLPFLMQLFPGEWVRELEVGGERSRYVLRCGEGETEIVFQAKGDRDSFATALASMAAKYVRERAMHVLNEWFCDRIEGLRATAGYPVDARRWLKEVGERFEVEKIIRER